MARLSVIIPTYNYASYIRQAVRTVLPQLLTGDELLVVDDGSVDGTRGQLDDMMADDKLHYYFQENAGVSVARNTGIEHAVGEYIIFLDADDGLLDDALQLFRSFIERHPYCDVISAGRKTIDEGGKQKVYLQPAMSTDRSQNFIDYVIHKKYSLSNGAVCIRRQVLSERHFPPQLRVSEDFCLYAQLLANYTTCSFPQATVLIRKHDDSLRHQLTYYASANEALIDILFDPVVLPEPLLVYKRRFHCQRLLSLFRAQYLAGESVAARQTYIRAIQCRPLNILKLSYLRKFMRLLLSR